MRAYSTCVRHLTLDWHKRQHKDNRSLRVGRRRWSHQSVFNPKERSPRRPCIERPQSTLVRKPRDNRSLRMVCATLPFAADPEQAFRALFCHSAPVASETASASWWLDSSSRRPQAEAPSKIPFECQVYRRTLNYLRPVAAAQHG